MSIGKRGFSTLESISSLVIFSSLSSGVLPQFTQLQNMASSSATQGVLGAVRTSLELQRMNMMLRCNSTLETAIHVEQLNSNDITHGKNAPCAQSQIPTREEKRFLTDAIPQNPFNNARKVVACNYNAENPCSAIRTEESAGWCYDSREGRFWANSNTTGECKL
ncbi:MAG: type II secretion system protein [Bdellovibrionota bacterium]